MASSSEHPSYVRLGRISSEASEAALLRALRELRPACDARLTACGRDQQGATLYAVELRVEPDPTESGAIDTWLRIKSALLAAFPADKPHAVRALD